MSAADAPTVVVELTPQGRAAVAVVLVDGPTAREAIGHYFVPVTPWNDGDPTVGRIVLGRWGGEGGEELIVCRRGAARYEVHCHGGGAAAPAIIEQLVSRGCRRVKWQEWMRAEPKGRDAATGGAQIALASAPTLRAASVLLYQYHGALSGVVDAARAAVSATEWVRAGEILDGVLQFRDVGLYLTSPWRVVLAGSPNVGKSSLINAIAGYQRAIVSPLPGTTRDIVTVNTAIDGWPVELADTAGLRATGDELESAGVALADAAIREADLVIMVSDASVDGDWAEEAVVRAPETARAIRVWNKIDLVKSGMGAGRTVGGEDAPARSDLICVSALTGEGVGELIAAIGGALVPVAPPAGAAVAFTREQVSHLEAAHHAVLDRDASRADAALAALLAFE
jgi:tRNA modification GTPase